MKIPTTKNEDKKETWKIDLASKRGRDNIERVRVIFSGVTSFAENPNTPSRKKKKQKELKMGKGKEKKIVELRRPGIGSLTNADTIRAHKVAS